LLALINANWTTQAIAAAVQLGVIDRLEQQPMPVDALARVAGCDAGALHRLLRSLVTIDVVVELDNGSFALGELGGFLGSKTPGSLGAWAEFCGTRSWAGWQHLCDCVVTGRSARELGGGSAGLAFLDDDAQAASLFNRAMESLSFAVAQAVACTLSFDGVSRVVDVGGGTGQLVSLLLTRHTGLRAVVHDRPHASEAARRKLQQAGIADRCEFVEGDFFEVVPAGGDLYLLKSVLHDWDDERARTILARCRAAMVPGARLIVIERLMPARLCASDSDRAVVRSDLNMLVGPGGHERTESAYRELLAASAFRVVAVKKLADGFSAIESS
jgi:ubiquinone/menaquinone biosynthesis C-methylase UbiE